MGTVYVFDIYDLTWFICLTTYQFLIDYSMSKFDSNNLHTIIYFQEFLSNSNNYTQLYGFQVSISI